MCHQPFAMVQMAMLITALVNVAKLVRIQEYAS